MTQCCLDKYTQISFIDCCTSLRLYKCQPLTKWCLHSDRQCTSVGWRLFLKFSHCLCATTAVDVCWVFTRQVLLRTALHRNVKSSSTHPDQKSSRRLWWTATDCDGLWRKQMYSSFNRMLWKKKFGSSPRNDDLVFIMLSKKKKRRFWVHPILQSNNREGGVSPPHGAIKTVPTRALEDVGWTVRTI